MHIDFTDDDSRLTVKERELLENILLHAAKTEMLPEHVEVSVMIVSNETIKQLNNDYRNIDEVTDVLSFPMFNRDEMEEHDREIPLSLGDIVISYDRAKEQAEDFNHSFNRELAFLTVHGFLHLLGYTHDHEEDEKTMFTKQEIILKEFQLER